MLYLRLLLTALAASTHARRELVLENLALRHQLAVYTKQGRRPQISGGARRFWSILAHAWAGWRGTLVMVEPTTVVRWHRSAWRAYWRRKSRRGPGRPQISVELQQLIVRTAAENPRWGAVRIVGELRALGFEVQRPDRATIPRACAPAPTRSVLAHVPPQPCACRHWNVTEHPTAVWIWRQLIEATPYGQQPRFLIRDRDRSCGADFIPKAARIGIAKVLTPVWSPNANAIAERMIGTLRRECLDHLIVFNERHLRRVLLEYVRHYNRMRPHRSLALDSPEGRPPQRRPPSGRVQSRPVLSGLHHEYQWAA